jgi:hypothetical protein
MGGLRFIGFPCRLLRRGSSRRDTLIRFHQSPESRAGALGDLAVLLGRPAVPAAELRATPLGQLPREHRSLIRCQPLGERCQAAEILSQHHELLEVGCHVCDVGLLFDSAADGNRRLERRLHRTAPPQRSPAVLDAGHELLLERILEMLATAEPRSSDGPGQQLEGGLAVAVLKVLRAQPVSMRPQQKLSSRECDQGDLLHRIPPADPDPGRVAPLTPRTCLSLVSGRHTRVSIERPCTPPSQFLIAPALRPARGTRSAPR